MNVPICKINLLKKLKATVVEIFIELSDSLELFKVHGIGRIEIVIQLCRVFY